MNRIAGCQSTNHSICRGELWECERCHKIICWEEGSTDLINLCDDCWYDIRVLGYTTSKTMSEAKYIRDGRAPIPKKESTSRVMSANKAKNTKPEITLRKALSSSGIRGYRLNWKKVPGRPDIAFTRKKVAVFVNGCFWHRCPYCKPSFPKSNVEFWENKFQKNKERDKRKKKELEKAGWKVFVFWECQIRKKADIYAKKINRYLLHL